MELHFGASLFVGWSLLPISDLILCNAFFGEDVSFEIELFASLSDKHPAYITSYLKIEAYSLYFERRATSFARLILCHILPLIQIRNAFTNARCKSDNLDH